MLPPSGFGEANSGLVAVREFNSGEFKRALQPFHCRLFRIGTVFDAADSIRCYPCLCGKFSYAPAHPRARHP